jgi:fido (protein-threonine AMPylation protein)
MFFKKQDENKEKKGKRNHTIKKEATMRDFPIHNLFFGEMWEMCGFVRTKQIEKSV